MNPKNFLVQIIVTSSKSAVVLSYFDPSQDISKKLKADFGDQISFVVQVALAHERKFLPYEITFSDPSFFGTSTLSVPSGGVSHALQVRSLQGSTSYSLNVHGFGCVFDPDIQSGPDTAPIIIGGALIVSVTVKWDTTANKITWSRTGGAEQNCPVQVNLMDNVLFVAKDSSGTGSGFAVAFSSYQTRWGSPFDLNGTTLHADPATPLSIGPKPAIDDRDAKAVFFFNMSIVVNGKTIPSPSCEMDYQ